MEIIVIVILLVCAFLGGMAGGPHGFALLLGMEAVAYLAVGPWESVIFGVFGCVGSWAQIYMTFLSNKRAMRRQQEAQAKVNADFDKRTKHKR